MTQPSKSSVGKRAVDRRASEESQLGNLVFEGPLSPKLRQLHIGKVLDEQCRQHPEKAAVICPWQKQALTYESLYSRSRDLAKSLLRHGVHPKDYIAVLSGNRIEYVELFLAAGAIGAIFIILNPTCTTDEIVALVQAMNPVAIFVADRIGYRNNKGIIAELSQKCNNSLVVKMESGVGSCSKTAGVTTWQQSRQNKSPDEEDLLARYWARGAPQDTLCIQYTSGTTGPRKAAMFSHNNLLNNAFFVGQRLDLTPADSICCCAPISHCFGLVCGLLAAIVTGCTIVLPADVFVADVTLEAVSAESCTVIHAVPPMFQALLDHPDATKYALQFKLRTGIIAGSSLSPVLLSRLAQEFGIRGLAYGFGQTELSCISFMTIPSKVSLLECHSSVGTLMPHTSARVVDEHLNDVPAGTAGELLVSGYLVFQGYHNNPVATAESFVRGSDGRQWLRTGDLATLSALGECTVMGRRKDMIKKGGENIFPADIEKPLEAHPSILTAAVVGVPDVDWGEIVVVFVECTKSPSETVIGSKDLKVWLRTRIAPHKVPQHFFWIGRDSGVPQALPMNGTGKLLKNELRAIARDLVQKI